MHYYFGFGRTWIAITLLIGGSCVQSHGAQPFRFEFRKGQTLRYRTQLDTTVEVRNVDTDLSTKLSMSQVKIWTVVETTDENATLELSLAEIYFEQTDPTGKKLTFDSRKPKEANPALAEQLGAMLGKPVVRMILKSDGSVQTSETLIDQYPARNEGPFFVVFPEAELTGESKWDRQTVVRLPVNPSQEMEKETTIAQSFSIQELSTDKAVVILTSNAVAPPEDPTLKIALLQFLPKGTITFDLKRGIMLDSQLATDQKVEDVFGPKTYYRFSSNYRETLVE